MVVRDNAVKAEKIGPFDYVKGLDARIDADDELDSINGRLLNHLSLHPVSVHKTARDVISGASTKHVQSFAQNDDGGGSIDIVVPVDQNLLLALNCLTYPLNRPLQVAHQKGVCKRIESGLKELLGCWGDCESTVDQQCGDCAGYVEDVGEPLDNARVGTR